jgi:hypothetical protein
MRIHALAALLVLASPPALAADPPAPPPAPGSAAGETLAEWPRSMEMGTGTLEIFQPQIEKFEGVTLSGRAALSWTAGKDKAPVFGVLWFTTTVSIDRDARTGTIETIRVDKVRFPNITKDEEKDLATILEREVPKWDLTLSLDSIQASLAVSQAEKKSSEGLKSPPPRMLFSNDPAVLLLYAGKPVEQPLPGSELKRVVNTPMFVAFDPSTRRYYLAGGKYWYEAPAATGPFTSVAAPSPAVKALFDSQPPPEKLTGDAAQQAAEKLVEEPAVPPRILVSTEPAELFVFDGPPKYVPVGDDADLLYAENTQRDVLVYVPTSETFVLASGRWFKSKSTAGPWTFVRPDKLPAGFSKLPADSPVGQVRTFVSGTDEALDALADSQIPQTTAVKRDQKFEVTYDGEPRFKPIEGTQMAFAVNTPFSVIQDAGRYWACDQGVWYVASGPRGPWAVSDRRPPDIDQVPPSAPVYNTKYVYVYQSTPEVVYVGYLPGYTGMYPYYGTVVYGTGFYYPPYIGPTVYYPRPCTYGFGVVYNPWVGFGFGYGYGSPFFYSGMRFGPAYGPGWYGAPGYRPFPPPYPGGWYRPPPGYRPPYPGYGYRPPPPGYGGRPPPPRPGGGYPPGPRPPGPGGYNNNIYARPQNQARNADRAQAISSRPAPRPVNRPNNVYADKQGNVYRQNAGGTWDKNTSQGWKPQPTASGTRPSSPTSSRPSAQPGSVPQTKPSGTSQPQTRPAPSQPQQQARPTTRPTPQTSSRPSYGNAPAGLSRDAAARQRAAAPPSRSGGGASHGCGGGGSRGGGGGGGGGRGR